MATKIHKNSFQGGMDKDTDPSQVEAFKYSDGYNVSLSVDGKEKKISSVLGTTTLQTIATTVTDRSKIHVMGMYEVQASIDSVETTSGIVFIYNGNDTTFKVYLVPEDGSDLFEMYSETVTLADEARFVDCVYHKEGGYNFAYFTDAEQAPKKIPLTVVTGGKGDGAGGGEYYFREEILMLRAGFRGNVVLGAVNENNGGDLLCGTYQFAVRLFNKTQNKYTKWSLLTQPIVVRMPYTNSTTAGERSFGGVGYVSVSDIDLTITTLKDYTTNGLYEYYQLAVIENINGDSNLTLTAKLLQPEAYTGVSITYNYSTNKQAKELIHIDELTVDDAAIKTLKTLVIKNNRMVALNVNYHDLNYADGTSPTIGSSTAALQKVFSTEGATAYRDSDNASDFVGYFRDELYRFGVVYEDEFGNFSKPFILDFSGILAAGKYTTSGGDFRFPPRSNSKYGVLLDGFNDVQALGLAIKALDNHPTWAKALHIVRVPRKKKVLFQTPYIPSILVQPAKTQGDYPAQRNDSSGKLELLNVEAANPDGTFIPKNFYHVLPKNMVRFGDIYGGTAATGSVYATHEVTITPLSYLSYAITSAKDGGVYDVQPLDNEWRAYTYNTASDSISIQKQVDGEDGVYESFAATDTGIFRLYNRAKGSTDAWVIVGTSVDVSATANPSFTGLDLTASDYLLKLTDS